MALMIGELASAAPAGVVLRDPRRTMTLQEVDDHLNRLVNGLLSLPMTPERRVAVFAENSAEAMLVYGAALLAGCSAVPVGFHLSTEEVSFILQDSKASVIFAGPETAGRAADAARAAGVSPVITWSNDGRSDPFDVWLAAQSSADPPTEMVPVPNLAYTSGTTGRPKGVLQPPSVFLGGESVKEYVEALTKDIFNLYGSHLVVSPLYHNGPQAAVRALVVGRPVSILGRFDAEATLKAIDRDRPEVTIMVPTHFKRLLALPEEVRALYDVSSLRLVGQTGSSCPIDVKRAMIEWFGPVFFEAYGGTESGIIAAIGSEDWLDHQGSVGKVSPQFTALVLDDAGREVPVGSPGRLFFKDETGRGIVYEGDPQKTAAAHHAPATFTLGDVGLIDSDGYLYITDRFTDMVVSGGVNIYPAEAEQVLVAHPAIADVAVIGVPNDDLGEELLALVVLRDDVDFDELYAFCRANLASYKCPKRFESVSEIAKDPMGKINKRILREPFWPTERTIG